MHPTDGIRVDVQAGGAGSRVQKHGLAQIVGHTQAVAIGLGQLFAGLQSAAFTLLALGFGRGVGHGAEGSLVLARCLVAGLAGGAWAGFWWCRKNAT